MGARPVPKRATRGLLDTGTLMLLPGIDDPADLPDEPLISTITLAELTVGPLVASSDAERIARQAHLQQAEADFGPLPFDAPAARAFGAVAVSLRRSGRQTRARAFDALIAAIALANDFAGIDGLEVVAVDVPRR